MVVGARVFWRIRIVVITPVGIIVLRVITWSVSLWICSGHVSRVRWYRVWRFLSPLWVLREGLLDRGWFADDNRSGNGGGWVDADRALGDHLGEVAVDCQGDSCVPA